MTDSISPDVKTCPHCKETKPLSDFYNTHNECRACSNRAVKAYHQRLKQRHINEPLSTLFDLPQTLVCRVCKESNVIRQI